MSSEMFPLPKGNRKSTNGHKGGCKRTWAEMPFLGRAWAQVASPTGGAQTLQGLTRTFWWVWGPPEQWNFVLYFPKETERRALEKPQVQPDSRQWTNNAEWCVQVSCPDSSPTEAHAHSGNTEELLKLAFELKNTGGLREGYRWKTAYNWDKEEAVCVELADYKPRWSCRHQQGSWVNTEQGQGQREEASKGRGCPVHRHSLPRNTV